MENNNLNLLLINRSPDPVFVDFHNFSLLSTEKGQNFSVKENIYFSFYKIGEDPPNVSGPLNGLLCLDDECDGKVALWNPSTREIKFLPQSTIQHPRPSHTTDFRCNCRSYNFSMFDLTSFGFDSKSEDYKVLRFVTHYFRDKFGYSSPCEPRQVHLYSLKSDSWKEIPHPDADVVYDRGYCPLFNNYINGVSYWIATTEDDTGDNLIDFILSFDFANEKFSTLRLPKFGRSLKHYGLEVLDVNGSLGAFVFPKKGHEKSFDLWVMNNGSWTREFCIESVPGVKKPLGFWKNGELFFKGSNHELVLFDPATREFKNLGIRVGLKLVTYVESLVPINGKSELEEDVIRRPVGDRQKQSGKKKRKKTDSKI
ncbi:hypothetical protein PTKIN_Ptkin14bG0203900 [Pterospermum kingtungense]